MKKPVELDPFDNWKLEAARGGVDGKPKNYKPTVTEYNQLVKDRKIIGTRIE